MNKLVNVEIILHFIQIIRIRKHIEFDDFWVDVEGDLDTDGFMNKSDVRRGYSDIRYNIHVETDAPKEKVEEFVAFLEKTCPVGDTIANPVNLKLNEIIIEKRK